MQQSVYIDLYFLVNFSMDLLCLMITASLLHRKVKRWRAILGAIFGGAYAAAALLLGAEGVVGFFADALAACLMCVITFAERRLSVLRVLQCAAVQVLVSMIIGGVMTALYSVLNRLDLPFEVLQGDGLSVWTFALLTAVAGVATVRGGSFLGISQKTKSVTVRAKLFGNEITLSAMVDSGNLLRDPVSGKSVIVADLDRISHVLPPALLRACQSGNHADWLSTYEHAKVTRPIPAQTATGASLLLAIVPDSLTLTVGSDTYPADYLIAPAPLGSRAQNFDAVIALN
ncbi:MAG: sigma-E processing peptidase SpoIIGA [Clostridia bacterium]|nr:sigma-E processing peptidase SpoIIGA [Clostridia bacterium]